MKSKTIEYGDDHDLVYFTFPSSNTQEIVEALTPYWLPTIKNPEYTLGSGLPERIENPVTREEAAMSEIVKYVVSLARARRAHLVMEQAKGVDVELQINTGI